MNSKKRIMMLLFFLLAIGIAVGADVFREVNNEEKGKFFFQIPETKEQVVTVDLARQGIVKYYLQPGTITLYGRGKITLPDKIHTKFYGVKGFLSQGSKRSVWTELTEDMVLESRQNGIVTLNIEAEIPYARTRQYEVGRAVLEFWKGNQLVSSMAFQFINSNYI